MVVAIIFVIIGITVFIPLFSSAGNAVGIGGFPATFACLWTAVAGATALFYAFNLFSNRGIGFYDVDIDDERFNSADTAPRAVHRAPANDFETKLRKLNKLKEDGLISDEEFDKKRAEIMEQQW
jgi:hypothetical protein